MKRITEELKNGTMTIDEANKFLLDLFGVVKRNSLTKIVSFALGIMTGITIGVMIGYIIVFYVL
jgi:hypothetical protein